MRTIAALTAMTTGLMALSGSAALAAPPTAARSEERLIWLEKRVTLIGSTRVVLPVAAQGAKRDEAATRIVVVFGDEDLPTSRPRTHLTTTSRPSAGHVERPSQDGHAGAAGRHARVPARR